VLKSYHRRIFRVAEQVLGGLVTGEVEVKVVLSRLSRTSWIPSVWKADYREPGLDSVVERIKELEKVGIFSLIGYQIIDSAG